MNNPGVLLFDEPSANLDMKASEDLGMLLKSLKDLGKAIIVADHRLHYLMPICDRIIMLEDGKITCECKHLRNYVIMT
ncbi:hypothetical protein AZF37_00680 [endosymbiont 'TC1' of Trimyema compressum]|nr:hypothetical protein AZF37_00680 [endosymbiont 'TC1' of Trimyema compressum]